MIRMIETEKKSLWSFILLKNKNMMIRKKICEVGTFKVVRNI